MTQSISTPKNLQVLYQHGALGPGSDLWIIPELEKSRWSQILDWYVNFQISRAKKHQSQNLSPEIKKIMEKNNIKNFDYSAPIQALMIASEGRLPNKQLVVLTTIESTPKEWSQQAFQIWRQLKSPTLRVFLPDFLSKEDFINLWPEKNNLQDITIVPSQSD